MHSKKVTHARSGHRAVNCAKADMSKVLQAAELSPHRAEQEGHQAQEGNACKCLQSYLTGWEELRRHTIKPGPESRPSV